SVETGEGTSVRAKLEISSELGVAILACGYDPPPSLEQRIRGHKQGLQTGGRSGRKVYIDCLRFLHPLNLCSVKHQMRKRSAFSIMSSRNCPRSVRGTADSHFNSRS